MPVTTMAPSNPVKQATQRAVSIDMESWTIGGD
jgi:hypothetical protein